MSTESKREVLEVALSELRSLRSARAVRGEREEDAREGKHASRRRQPTEGRDRCATQVYEQRGDVYFLSDKKTVTANVKSALAKERASEAAKER